MSNMDKFLSGLEKRGSLNEETVSAVEATKGQGWFYVPEKTFLSGTLKPIVHEVSEDKWEILFCAPETKSSAKVEKGLEDLMNAKYIEMLQGLSVMSEEVEGDKASLSKWYVKTKWSGSYSDCLEKCVSLVEGKSDSVPSQFKTK